MDKINRIYLYYVLEFRFKFLFFYIYFGGFKLFGLLCLEDLRL